MRLPRLALAALLYFVVLFVGSGVSQALPWGVPSAQSLYAASPETVAAFGTDAPETVAPGTFTTPRFDEVFVDEVTILLTDDTVSWVATRPVAYYDPGSYMAKEALTQVLVAILLTTLLALTRALPLRSRLGLVGLAGLAGGVAIYGQLFNWWGLTAAYAGGAVLNLVASWLLGGFLVARFVLPGEG